MPRAVCLLVNLGRDGCTINTLPVRHSYDTSFIKRIVAFCGSMPLEHRAKVVRLLRALKARGDSVVRVLNLTLHPLEEVLKEAPYSVPVYNFLGDPPPSKCTKCNSELLLVTATLLRCPCCGEEYKVRVKLYGDKLSGADVERLLKALGECDNLLILGEAPRARIFEALLKGVQVFWGLNTEVLEDMRVEES